MTMFFPPFPSKNRFVDASIQVFPLSPNILPGIAFSNDPHPVYTLCWFLHPAHCHQSKRSLQAAQCRIGRGKWYPYSGRDCSLYILSQELRKQFQIISELRAETKALQGDNLKLYEKVRYMQSYREDSGSRPVTQLDPLPPPSALPDRLSKYQTRYEEAMNPFEVFRGRVWLSHCFRHRTQSWFQEASRAYQALNPAERGVLAMTRLILGSRRARALLICYAFVLHVMVLYTTYGCTSSSVQMPSPRPYSWYHTWFPVPSLLLSYSNTILLRVNECGYQLSGF